MARKGDSDLAAELKAKVALAALRGDKTLGELATQFGLDPAQIEEWKTELLRNAEAAFRSNAAGSEAPAMPVSPPQTKASTSRPPTIRPLPTLDDPPTLPLWPSEPKPPEHKTTLDDDYWADATMVPRSTTGRLNLEARVTPLSPRERPWTRKLLALFFVGWREKHHAAKTGRELLKLYRTTAAARPGLKKEQLYRQIVMERLGGSSAAADTVLARAKESFATWPVERALRFRDVVHYIAVSDYLASTDHAEDWTRENLGRVVAKLVSDDL